ncbi:MAG: phosphoribosylformylglycinamidine synthase subunit PurQ [Bacteroides sp.]
MKVGVVVFPGSNCDRDSEYCFGTLMGHEVVRLWHKEATLPSLDLVVIPGGFSYGDYLRSGALARFSPVMEAVTSFAEAGGKVLGICNGFQILCEAGLLPGTLRINTPKRFVCKNVHLLPEVKSNIPTASLDPQKPLLIPIAHGEGSYYADRETLSALRVNNQILFRYCDENGHVSDAVNPNGSVDGIAGIASANHCVVGMMPHPERAADPQQGNTDGLLILQSLLTFWTKR